MYRRECAHLIEDLLFTAWTIFAYQLQMMAFALVPLVRLWFTFEKSKSVICYQTFESVVGLSRRGRSFL